MISETELALLRQIGDVVNADMYAALNVIVSCSMITRSLLAPEHCMSTALPSD